MIVTPAKVTEVHNYTQHDGWNIAAAATAAAAAAAVAVVLVLDVVVV